MGCSMFVVNTRCLSKDKTGVQRYTENIVKHLPNVYTEVRPSSDHASLKGHIWEQMILPFRANKKLLWSPANTGPIIAEQQILTVHDLSPFDHPEWFSRKFSIWYSAMYRLLLPRVREIITVSEFSRRQICRHFPAVSNKVNVISLAVDENLSLTRSGSDSEDIRKLGLHPNRFFLILGTIEPRKNVYNALQAWELARKNLPSDWKLAVVGSPGSKAVFAQENLNYCREGVLWLGVQNDEILSAIIRNARSLIFVSLYEGFGLPVLEAMACGTPVISSNSTAIPEITENGAISVDPTNIGEIAEAIICMGENNQVWQELGHAAKAVAGKYSWQKAASETYDVIKRHL